MTECQCWQNMRLLLKNLKRKEKLGTYTKKLNLLIKLRENRIKNKIHDNTSLNEEIKYLEKKIYNIENDIDFSRIHI